MSYKAGSGKKVDPCDSRTDSGFLSGTINSETMISGEIQPEESSRQEKMSSPQPRGRPESTVEFKSKDDYMRLDSGVDLVSDQMSDLCIDEDQPVPSVQISLTDQEETTWQLYFQQDDEGDTQLHIAIIHGFVEVVFHLIRMVPSPEYLNICNDLRQTALHLAVLTRQPRIIRRLIVAGADPCEVDRNGNTALHLAACSGDALCVKELTEKIAPHEVAAAQLRYTPPAPRKIHSFADMVNYEGLTAVHLSAVSGHFGILKHLVKCGADIDAREGKAGRTVLHMAAEIGNDRLAVLLLRDLVADPEMPNYAGQTAYHVARRNPQFLRTLVAYGAVADTEYFSSDDDDEDDISGYDNGFRDFMAQGQMINAA